MSSRSTPIMQLFEMARTVPTCSHWVTSHTRLMWKTPFSPSFSPWSTVSTRRKPGRPLGRGLRRLPILICRARVFLNVVRRRL